MRITEYLTYPTEICWSEIKKRSSYENNQLNTLLQIVTFGFYLIGLIFSSPFYISGRVFEVIVQSSPNKKENSIRADSASKITHIAHKSLSIPSDPELAELTTFASSPSWRTYGALSIANQYLIAGSHYYTSFGWSISSKFHLLEKFEKAIKSAGSFSPANKAIKEAIEIRKKISFLKNFLKAPLESKKTMLDEVDADTLRQIQYYIGRKNELSSKTDAIKFGKDTLQKNLANPLISNAISSMLSYLNNAYPHSYYPHLMLDKPRADSRS
ncbi:MAG: hypothetical protein KR126chlam3_00939 [Chlamydiae bacterium]|nr:hypothetical protein [Chlamydiota bacterium]